jgi:hypothetical protein
MKSIVAEIETSVDNRKHKDGYPQSQSKNDQKRIPLKPKDIPQGYIEIVLEHQYLLQAEYST